MKGEFEGGAGQEQRGLVKRPMARSDAWSVRAAAVPTWQVTMPAKAAVVAVT